MTAPPTDPAPSAPIPDYEDSPLTRQEYIAAMVHLYRGELHRANAWRLRLDHTTNLAVISTAGLLAYAFGDPSHGHWVLLGGLALLSFFLLIEARRFRYADVFRARVRMIEENFYAPILRRDPGHRSEWGALVARDLFRPRLRTSRVAAVRSRLAKNYWAIYLVTVVAWVVRVLLVPTPTRSLAELEARLGGGDLIPWWAPVGFVALFVLGGAALVAFGPRVTSYDLDAWKYERDTGGTTPGLDV